MNYIQTQMLAIADTRMGLITKKVSAHSFDGCEQRNYPRVEHIPHTSSIHESSGSSRGNVYFCEAHDAFSGDRQD